MNTAYQYSAISDIGRKRNENQDCFVCKEELGLFAVSDGMGGIAYGKETAEEVIHLLTTFVSFEEIEEMEAEEVVEFLEEMLLEINEQIVSMGNEDGRRPLYGATLAGFLLHEEHAMIFHVGDSRVYHLKKDEQLQQITIDDNLLSSIVKAGIELEEKEKNAASHILFQHMGMCQTMVPHVQICKLEEDDILCICSDGLTGMVSDFTIETILKEETTVEEKTRTLVEQANEAGGKDNITVIVWKKEKQKEEKGENQ